MTTPESTRSWLRRLLPSFDAALGGTGVLRLPFIDHEQAALTEPPWRPPGFVNYTAIQDQEAEDAKQKAEWEKRLPEIAAWLRTAFARWFGRSLENVVFEVDFTLDKQYAVTKKVGDKVVIAVNPKAFKGQTWWDVIRTIVNESYHVPRIGNVSRAKAIADYIAAKDPAKQAAIKDKYFKDYLDEEMKSLQAEWEFDRHLDNHPQDRKGAPVGEDPYSRKAPKPGREEMDLEDTYRRIYRRDEEQRWDRHLEAVQSDKGEKRSDGPGGREDGGNQAPSGADCPGGEQYPPTPEGLMELLRQADLRRIFREMDAQTEAAKRGNLR